MREIKFRGRGAYQRSVWYVGDLVRCDDGRITIRKDEANEFYVDPETVGQFTGLKDCEGREIYEGDVVTLGDDPTPSAVRWNDELACYIIVKTLILGHVYKYVRVIGNVHDSPELLEADDERD